MTDLVIELAPDHMAVVPIEAIAAWGELLGLSDADALAAILERAEPTPQSDDPDDNGWTALYVRLTDEIVTQEEVSAVNDLGMQALDQNLATPQTFSALGRFGQERLVAQTQALVEDAQRTAQASLGLRGDHSTLAAEVIAEHVLELAKAHDAFRQALTPPLRRQ